MWANGGKWVPHPLLYKNTLSHVNTAHVSIVTAFWPFQTQVIIQTTWSDLIFNKVFFCQVSFHKSVLMFFAQSLSALNGVFRLPAAAHSRRVKILSVGTADTIG